MQASKIGTPLVPPLQWYFSIPPQKKQWTVYQLNTGHTESVDLSEARLISAAVLWPVAIGQLLHRHSSLCSCSRYFAAPTCRHMWTGIVSCKYIAESEEQKTRKPAAWFWFLENLQETLHVGIKETSFHLKPAHAEQSHCERYSRKSFLWAPLEPKHLLGPPVQVS